MTNPMYKTYPCEYMTPSSLCRRGSSCKFSHGPHDLRPRVIKYGYKSSVCSSYRTGTCPYGVQCKYIHNDFRMRRGEHEFWLVSPTDSLIRVEYVAKDDAKRLTFLAELVHSHVNMTNMIVFAQQVPGLMRSDDTLDICAFDAHVTRMMALQLKTVGKMIISLVPLSLAPVCFPLIRIAPPSISSSSSSVVYSPPLLSPTPTRPFLSPMTIHPSRPAIVALPMPIASNDVAA